MRKLTRIKKHLNKGLILYSVGMVVTCVFLFIQSSFYIRLIDPFNPESISFDFYDIYYKNFYNPLITEDNDIVGIDVGDLSRREILLLIKSVIPYSKVVGVDIFFDFVNNHEGRDIFKEITESENLKKIVFAYPLSQLKIDKCEVSNIYGTQVQLGHAQLNSLNILSPRSINGKLTCKSKIFYSFSYEIARKYIYMNSIDTSNFIIDYTSDIKNIHVVRGTEIFSKSYWKERIKNKIVVIGDYNNNGRKSDSYYSPFNPTYFQRSQPDMAGAMVHTNAIKTLLSKNKIIELNIIFQYVLVFLIACAYLKIHVITDPYLLGTILSKLSLLLIFIALFVFFILIYDHFRIRFRTDIFLLTLAVSETFYSILYKFSETK